MLYHFITLLSFTSTVLKSDEDFVIDDMFFTQTKPEHGHGKIVHVSRPSYSDDRKPIEDMFFAVVANGVVYLSCRSFSHITGNDGKPIPITLPENCRPFEGYMLELNKQMEDTVFAEYCNSVVSEMSPKKLEKMIRQVGRYKLNEDVARRRVLLYGEPYGDAYISDSGMLSRPPVFHEDDGVFILCGLGDAETMYSRRLHYPIPEVSARAYNIPICEEGLLSFCNMKLEQNFDELMKSPVLVEDWELAIADVIRPFVVNADNPYGKPAERSNLGLHVTFQKGRKCSTKVFSAKNIMDNLVTRKVFKNTNLCCKDIVGITFETSFKSDIYTRNAS